MKIIRRVVFWLFCLLYIIICPAIVLSALGYIFSPRQQEMVHTGLVALTTFPKDATVFLGKSRYAYRTPTVLRDLLPGSYTIKLYKKDFLPWEHTVVVEAGKAISLSPILLEPQRREELELVTGALEQLVPLEGTGFLLAARGPRLGDYYAYDTVREKLWRVAPAEYEHADERVISLVSSPGSLSVVFVLDDKGRRRYVAARLREKKARLTDITMLFPEAPQQLAWDPDDDDRLFFRHKGGIGRVVISDKALYPGYVPGARTMGVSPWGVLYIDAEGRIERVRHDRGTPQVAHESEALAQEIAEGAEVVRIENAGANVTTVLFGNGRLLVCGRDGEVRRFDEIEGFRYARGDKRLLIWSKERVGLVDLSYPLNGEVQDEVFPVRWVYQGGSAIRECCWVGDTGHVMVRERDEIVLVQVVPQGESHAAVLAQLRRDTRAGYVEDTGAAYFIRRGDGALCRVDVAPRKQFLPLTLPKQDKDEKNAPGDE